MKKKHVWPYPDAYITYRGKRIHATLTAHPCGQWVRSRKGKLYYFGSVDKPEIALARWREQWPSILDGVTPEATFIDASAATVEVALNDWLQSKHDLLASGELSPATFRKYREYVKQAAPILGRRKTIARLSPADFTRLKAALSGYSIYRRSDIIGSIRGAFGWAVKAGIIAKLPDFGPEFAQPRRRAIRRERRKNKDKVMPAAAIRRMLRAADPCERAMVLLGINCGMKSMDIATIDELTVDLPNALIHGERHKTGSLLMAPLWAETVEAIRAVAHVSAPTLRTAKGLPWNGRGTDRVGKSFAALRKQLLMPDSFTQGSLRHTLRSVGGRVNKDAVRLIMGQTVGDELDETYDHDDWLPRVKEVSDYVHDWLFNPTTKAASRYAAWCARRSAQASDG